MKATAKSYSLNRICSALLGLCLVAVVVALLGYFSKCIIFLLLPSGSLADTQSSHACLTIAKLFYLNSLSPDVPLVNMAKELNCWFICSKLAISFSQHFVEFSIVLRSQVKFPFDVQKFPLGPLYQTTAAQYYATLRNIFNTRASFARI